MHFTALLMSSLAASTVAATVGLGHSGKMHNHAHRHVEIMRNQEKRDLDRRNTNMLNAADSSKLLALGFKGLGLNPTSKGAIPWIGNDGQFTSEFFNTASEDLILTVWGPAGSWVNAVTPQLTISIPKNKSQIVSFPVGWSGAWAAVHSKTTLVNGQIFDTWGEATFAPPYSVVDVSREVNMGGRPMAIIGPTCVTDMNTCVFRCLGGVNSCMYGYELHNCATGSQAGANFGTYEGAPSGGCGGMGNSANLKTYLG